METESHDLSRPSLLARALDALLELLVLPSFSRIGPAVRRRLFRWTSPAPGALEGRTALVTGATGGLGTALARELAHLGARVVLVGRDRTRLEALRAELGARFGADRFPVVVADLSRLDDVRAAVDAVRASEPVLDLLVDNAGAIRPSRTLTPDGIEATMALMVVGPFTLVSGLLPVLRASSDPRVITVTSGGQYAQTLDVDDLDGTTIPYNGTRFYARAKRAQVGLVREWARRLGPADVAVNAMHPGWAATPGLAESLPAFSRLLGPILRTAVEGIDTIVWLATAPREAIGAGHLYLDRRRRPFDRAPWTRLDAAARRRLWDAVVSRAGVADPAPSTRRRSSPTG